MYKVICIYPNDNKLEFNSSPCIIVRVTPLPFHILQYNPRYLFITGSYCPEGTDGPLSCPPGTYGATTGLRNVSECTPCTAGSYCTTPGLMTPEGQGNSIIILYILSVWQLKISLFKIQLKILNFLWFSFVIVGFVWSCVVWRCVCVCRLIYDLSVGHSLTLSVCLSVGLCAAGYYCEEGSDSIQKTICTSGHFCPVGTAVPNKCPEVRQSSHVLISLSFNLICS